MSLHDKNQSLHTEIIAENCGHFCCAERPHRRKKVLFSPLHQMILSSITTHTQKKNFHLFEFIFFVHGVDKWGKL